MKTSEKTDKIFPALLKVKSELKAVTKDSDNPYYNSKYADLNSHLEEAEPALLKQGLMLLQPTSVINGDNVVESTIVHVESGQWVTSDMKLLSEKPDMQKAGSGVTYGRRYTLGALLSMRAEDDDGQAAAGKPVKLQDAKKQEATTEVKATAVPPKSTTPGFQRPKAKTTGTKDVGASSNGTGF